MAKKKAARRSKKPTKKRSRSGKPRGDALRLEWLKAGALKDNPANWRTHPASQVGAWRSIKDRLGWLRPVIFNEATGRLIDGHMRKNDAPADELIPVLIGRWSEAQEKRLLASFDPLAGMAGIDVHALQALLSQVEAEEPAVQAVLESLEKAVDRELKVAESGADDEDEDEDGAGDGGEEAERSSKTVKPAYPVMVRCGDELAMRTLAAELRAEGLDVKCVEAV